MSEITAVIDRLRRDIERIENGQATTLREKGHQIGRIVTAFQGILEEYSTSVTHLAEGTRERLETAKVKQIQLLPAFWISSLDRSKSQRLSAFARASPTPAAPPPLEHIRCLRW